MPADAADRYYRLPVVGTLLALSNGAAPPASVDVEGRSPCRYLVVRRSASSAALLRYVAGLHAEPMMAEGDRDLYRVW
jgi:hypothetical protein